MHWIVNKALEREAGYRSLIDQLQGRAIPYTLVRKPPLVGHLIAMHDDLDENSDHVPIMLDPIEGPVFVIGTTSMKSVSDAHGWNPGFIDAPTQQECFDAWGDHMLNIDARFGELGDVSPPEEGDFFIRPDEPGKAFSGRMMKQDEFADWRRDLLRHGSLSRASPATRIMISPMRTIWSEYRCIVVDGEYVTGSRYKTGRTWSESPDVGGRIIRYVNERAAEWRPRRAMCIDVADTPDGLRIVETNSVSSAGFYANDMARFVDAVDAIGEGSRG
jgi:hypothetical protein